MVRLRPWPWLRLRLRLGVCRRSPGPDLDKSAVEGMAGGFIHAAEARDGDAQGEQGGQD